MEVTRKQVPLNGLAEFDKRVGPSYEKALTAIDSFMKFQTKYKRSGSVAGDHNMKKGDEMESQMHGTDVKACLNHDFLNMMDVNE